MSSPKPGTKDMDRPVDVVAGVLREAGITRIYGVPGEGSTIDLVDAAHREGVSYVLTVHETGAAFMAATEAELTGRPGVCLVTKGPGLTNLATGIAHALLDRIPLIAIADDYPPSLSHRVVRQNLPQLDLVKPLVKWHALLGTLTPRRLVEAAVCLTKSPPSGPVLLTLPFGPATEPVEPEPTGSLTLPPEPAPAPAALELAVRAINGADRPLLLVGMGARAHDVTSATVTLAERLGAATVTTPKAKGVIPASHPLYGGSLPGSAARGLQESADLFVAIGFDPVELPHPWNSSVPILLISQHPYHGTYFSPTHQVSGEVGAAVQSLVSACRSREAWDQRKIAERRIAERERFARGSGLTPYRVLTLTRELSPHDAAVTADAGAHKQLANIVWEAERPLTYLTSNGLGSMGFALPAAGAAAMVTKRRAVCLTGDAGLLMMLGELETIERLRAPVTVVVFDDGGHSVIRIHQQRRGYTPRGVDIKPVRFDRIAEAVGGQGFTVRTPVEFARALEASESQDGYLSVIAAKVDAAWYGLVGL